MANYCVPQRGTAALLTISAQQDFLRPGSPVRATGVQRVRPALQRLAQGARDHELPIFHAVRLYRPDGTNVDACRRQAVEEGLRVFMPGSLGAELLDEIRPEGAPRLDAAGLMSGKFQDLARNEWAFYRPRWGAFHDTRLEERLERLGVNTLVLCGFSFATALRATIYEASARDYRIVVACDGVGGGSEEAIAELGRIGVYLMTARACVSWFAGSNGSSEAA